MTPRRRSRTTRPPAGKYTVTERDLEVLFAVGRMGQATSHQLQRLFFGDKSTALRRFAKLVSLKLLNVWVTSQERPNVYTLGPRAQEVLQSAGFSLTELHKSKVHPSGNPHLHAINEVRIEFVLGIRSHHDVTLEGFLSDLDLRRRAGASPPAYVPDALVLLVLPGGQLVLVVEVDLGTEGLAVFKGKVETTVALWQTHRECWGAAPGTWRPVVFVPGERRARSLARGIVDAGGGELWFVSELQQVHAHGVFGPVFATATEVAMTPSHAPLRYPGALVGALAAADTEGAI